jgi:hypothetical protein
VKRDSDILHDKNDPHLQGGRLYSMLDLMGATMTCDLCGRWQRLDTLFDFDKCAAEKGWVKRNEQDLCRICATDNVAQEIP